MHPSRSHHDSDAYRLRLLGCVLAGQLVVWLLMTFWPAPGPDPLEATIYHIAGQEVIPIEEILPTQQSLRAAPPPPPDIPVVVPDDVVLEPDLLFQEQSLTLDRYAEDEAVAEGNTAQGAPTLAAPAVGPKPIRFVEPEYPASAQKAGIRAEVTVQVLVDEKGRVTSAEILERFILDRDANRKAVSQLDHGLEDAALRAASDWLFQPARDGGRTVRSYTILTFRFGR